MQNPIKKLLAWVFVVVFVIVAGVMIFMQNQSLKHIKDTNGDADFTLQTITDENIIQKDLGMKGGIHVGSKMLNDNIFVSSGKFTGVYEVLSISYWGASDFVLELEGFEVKSGNFKAVIINDDKIIKELEFNTEDGSVKCRIEGIKGDVRFRIAGEEADFTFHMDEDDYNRFHHE